MPLGQTIGAVFYCLNGNRCYKKISDRFSIFLPVMNQNEQQILARALFCHAAHSGSLSEAARVLGVDRGSVRNLIRSLESEVGESLLTRSTAGVKPTAAGKRLYSLWSPAVAALENAAEAAGTSERARINVSLPTTTGTTLLMPVIVLGGIYSGIFTATEAGAVSCVYALIVAVFIYKTLTWKEVLRIIRDSAVACSVILFIMGTSTVFSWLFTVSGISGWLVSSVTGAGLGYYPILLIITVILLIFGFFLEGIATVSMLLPLFIPIAQAVGIDLLHLGMIVTMTNVMGCMTPPVANNIFAASTFTGLPMGRISKGELPYLGCFFVVLLIVVFCPGLITMFG